MNRSSQRTLLSVARELLCQGTERLEPFATERAQHRAIERAEGLRFAFAGGSDALFGALLERPRRQRAPRQCVRIPAEQALEPGHGIGTSLAFEIGRAHV